PRRNNGDGRRCTKRCWEATAARDQLRGVGFLSRPSHHVTAGTEGGGDGGAKSTEGGCRSGAQGSCGSITEGCGGADGEGPGKSSVAACAGAEYFGLGGACAGAEEFGIWRGCSTKAFTDGGCFFNGSAGGFFDSAGQSPIAQPLTSQCSDPATWLLYLQSM
ncbi:unnamed protein product, partial [Urochloa humidicola]